MPPRLLYFAAPPSSPLTPKRYTKKGSENIGCEGDKGPSIDGSDDKTISDASEGFVGSHASFLPAEEVADCPGLSGRAKSPIFTLAWAKAYPRNLASPSAYHHEDLLVTDRETSLGDTGYLIQGQDREMPIDMSDAKDAKITTDSIMSEQAEKSQGLHCHS